MGRTFSQDLRSRVIAAVDGGMSRNAAAARFGISIATAVRWVHVWRATGVASACPKGGDTRSHRIEAFRGVILAAVDAELDVTLTELADMLRQEHGVSFARSTLWRFLDRQGLTLQFLPPYSPDFNPIENAFAKLKARLRKAAARTLDDLWNAVRDALPSFTPAECANYFAAAGYEPE